MLARLAALSPTAVANLMGVAGLVLVVAAVASLVGWRWSLLLAGLLLVGLSYVTHRNAVPVAGKAAAARVAPPRPVALHKAAA